MKKTLLLGLAAVCAWSLTACGSGAEAETTTAPETTKQEKTEMETENSKEKDEYYVEMVGNSFAIQFCNINVDGAKAAADELGNVKLNYNASQDSSQVQEQIDILNQAIAKKPDAILIAAADPDALEAQMIKARDEGIPVVAYDISFNHAPEGALAATVSTNNEAAAGLAAEKLMENEAFVEQVKQATAEKPMVVSCLAPDAVMTAHEQRINGFTLTLYELLQEYQPGAVEITGHTSFEKASENPAAVTIRAEIPPTKADADIRNQAQKMINGNDVAAVFCVNEASVTALLSATTDGTDLDREKGKYKDLIAIGFDAGKTMKGAVASQYFMGQSPRIRLQWGMKD
ncbi:sugar ABC transporter substrate-binding protein [Hungatella hathewayi]|nr:sugar ABC transporter substrate-binding protein [Hungatella hathewayi]